MNELGALTEQRIAEIKRSVEKFQSDFEEGTSDPDHFMTMSEIERLWAELRNNTDKIYSDMVMELMANVNEEKLISKKNENSENTESPSRQTGRSKRKSSH